MKHNSRAFAVFCVVVFVAALVPLRAHGDEITEPFSITISGQTVPGDTFENFSAAGVPQFNPLDGTLNSVSFFMTGSIAAINPNVSPQTFVVPVLLNSETGATIFGLASEEITISGQVLNIDESGSVPYLTELTGAGTVVPALYIDNAYDLSYFGGGLTGQLIYDYTPAVPTPESSTLLLVGLGMACWFGLAAVQRKHLPAGCPPSQRV